MFLCVEVLSPVPENSLVCMPSSQQVSFSQRWGLFGDKAMRGHLYVKLCPSCQTSPLIQDISYLLRKYTEEIACTPPPLKKGREKTQKKTGQKLVILKQFQNSFKILQPVLVLKLENCYQSNLEVHDVLRDCMLCCNEENTGYCIFIMWAQQRFINISYTSLNLGRVGIHLWEKGHWRQR